MTSPQAQREVHDHFAPIVVCPMNGRPAAERALALSSDVGAKFGADVVLFGATENEHEAVRHKQYLETQCEAGRQRQPGVSFVPEVVVNPHPPVAISQRAAENAIVAMATSTRSFLHLGYIGSAAEAVVRQSHRPTILVGPRVDPQLGLNTNKIIVPVDGSDLSEQVLTMARWWADQLDVPLWVMTVVTPRDAAQARATSHGPTTMEASYVRHLAQEHDASWEVLHSKDEAGALTAACGDDGLMVMSTHGRGGLRRMALGSVTTATVRHAQAPVIAVSPTIAES